MNFTVFPGPKRSVMRQAQGESLNSCQRPERLRPLPPFFLLWISRLDFCRRCLQLASCHRI